MTKWLNPTEQRAWRILVTLTTRLPAAMDTQMQRESGVTHFEYVVLELLAAEPERRLQLSELASRANASLSRLSHVVTKLERLGWAERELSTGRRGADAVLTETGYRKVQQATPGYLEAVRGLVLDGLDEQQTEQLAELGQAMVAQLEAGLTRGLGRTNGRPSAAEPSESASE